MLHLLLIFCLRQKLRKKFRVVSIFVHFNKKCLLLFFKAVAVMVLSILGLIILTKICYKISLFLLLFMVLHNRAVNFELCCVD